MATQQVTIEELQGLYNISSRDLNRRCSDQHMLDISSFFSTWKLVAPRIGLEQHDVDAVQRNGHKEEERRLGALRKWKEKYGYKATYRKLIEALLAISQADLAERVCQVITARKGVVVLPDCDTEESDFAPSERKRPRKGSQQNLDGEYLPQTDIPALRKRRKSQPMLLDIFGNEETRRRYMCSGKKTICLLTIGKTATGKSSMVNGIMGSKLVEEGGISTRLTNGTTTYEHRFYINDIGDEVTVKLFDTPGLSDFLYEEPKEEDEIISQLEKLKKDVDHVFYCFDMRRRFETSDLEGLKKFSEIAGPDIWKNVTFALTFANQVVPIRSEKDKQEHFETVIISWIEMLEIVMMKKLSIPENVVNEIPVVPVGYNHESPPDREEWFSPLWATALQRMKPEAQPSMLAVSLERLRETDISRQAVNSEDKNVYLAAEYPKYTLGSSKHSGGKKSIENRTTLRAELSRALGLVAGATNGKVGGYVTVRSKTFIESAVKFFQSYT